MKVNEFSAWYHRQLSDSTTHRINPFTHNAPGMPPDWPLLDPLPIRTWDVLHPMFFPNPIFPSACLIPAVGHVVSYTESNDINVSASGAAVSKPGCGTGTHWPSWNSAAPSKSSVSSTLSIFFPVSFQVLRFIVSFSVVTNYWHKY